MWFPILGENRVSQLEKMMVLGANNSIQVLGVSPQLYPRLEPDKRLVARLATVEGDSHIKQVCRFPVSVGRQTMAIGRLEARRSSDPSLAPKDKTSLNNVSS